MKYAEGHVAVAAAAVLVVLVLVLVGTQPESELVSGAELASEVAMVKTEAPSSGELWHLAYAIRPKSSMDGNSSTPVLLSKAHTHTRLAKLADGRPVRLLALTGVNTHPSV
eukprot:SAG31_NODE_972_length_10644_cov_3.435372_7_plen_111_part_00